LSQDFEVLIVKFICAPGATLDPNFLRGRFGKALHEIDRDAYDRWFAPRTIDGPSGLRDAPRAFVMRVAGPQSFAIHLFDLRDGGAELVRRAFLQIVAIEHVESERLRLPLESRAAASRVRVNFVTPTELKGADRPEFAILFARLRDRISTLRARYQGAALEIDFRGMAERASAIRMTRCEIQRVEAERVSRSTGQRHSLGGFTGVAEYEGELGEFLPYLEIGKYTGVGRQTVWGKGEIHAVLA
jgi:CRISPR-associated endoribonuclease Cas6